MQRILHLPRPQSLAVLLGFLACAPLARQAAAQNGPEPLTLEAAARMAMEDSYRMRQLQLEVERTSSLLEAERAGLRSRVYMNFDAPTFERISETKWNSTLGRDEIVREHSQLWQMEFSIEQPVILFGYPTNGYLSLNNRIYRYTQYEDDGRSINYYNRYFVAYEQPLFQPNELRNELEEARLDLESAGLEFQDDAVDMLGDIARDFYQLVEIAYQEVIYTELVRNLEAASAIAQERFAADSSRAIELNQVAVGLANAREQMQQARVDFRLSASEMKQTLRMAPADSITVSTELQVPPISVDAAEAVDYGLTLRPQLRFLEIQRRNDELDLADTRGEDSFRLNLELTYGREMEDPYLRRLLREPSNSYTLSVSGYVPLWDWGRRRARARAGRLRLERTLLSIEETREVIEREIRNVVRNLDDYQQRALDMQENLELSRQVSAASLARYRAGSATMLDVLQAFERQAQTAENYLDAYLGYRGALLDLQQLTYYDFELDMPLLERFSIEIPGTS